MMRKIFISLLPCLSLWFTACGGSEAPPPQPPSMQNAQYQPVFQDLQAAANAAKQSCSSEYSPVFLLLAANFRQQQTTNPSQPVPVPQQVQPQGGSCNNDLMNFMLQFMTIRQPDGQMYAEQPQNRQWAASTLASIGARVVRDMQMKGINVLGDPALQRYLQTAGVNQVRNVIVPGMGQYAGAARQGFDYFAGIN